MLFGPENGEQFGDPDVDRSQAMQTGWQAEQTVIRSPGSLTPGRRW
jgi:hypothetical protein